MSAKNKTIDSKNERFFYVYLTENLDVGHQSRHTPQHITLIPPFVSNEKSTIEIAKKVAGGFSPFAVEFGDYHDFGHNKNIPTILVKPSEKLNGIHTALIEGLKDAGIDIYNIYKNQFVDDKFMPHVTLKSFHPEIDSKKPIMIDHIAVIYKYKDTKTIIAKFMLGAKK